MTFFNRIIKLGLLAVLMSVSFNAFAQKTGKMSIEQLKNDTSYYYGISEVRELDIAKKEAFNRLYSNIALNCHAKARFVNQNISADSSLMNIIKSFGIDENKTCYTGYPILKDNNQDLYQYVVYMKRSVFREMCGDKTAFIKQYIDLGFAYEDKGNYEDALKYYYWGLVLWYSHPYCNKLDMKVSIELLEKRIKETLGSFNFIIPPDTKIDRTQDIIQFDMVVNRSNGQSVTNLKCDYFNGHENFEDLVSKGKLHVYLHDNTLQSFNIRIIYGFENQAPKHVYNALKHIKIPAFTERVHHVDLTKNQNVELTTEKNYWHKIDKHFGTKQADILSKRMELIEKSLRNNNPSLAKECFSEEGYGMFDTLCGYGKIDVPQKPEYHYITFNGEILCRGLSVHFIIGNTGFEQDLVFRFDSQSSLVTSVAFRLSSIAENDILSKSDKWPMESTLQLMNFLEDYQTAYALKRHKYIESIYSDSALIIVGHVVKKVAMPDSYNMHLPQEDIIRVKKDKKTYINDLERCFATQNYIRLRFTDTDFVKDSERPDLYGISVRQDYYSSTYCDVGYLLLIVDLEKTTPIIYVRTWQPDKPGVTPYKMHNFRIN